MCWALARRTGIDSEAVHIEVEFQIRLVPLVAKVVDIGGSLFTRGNVGREEVGWGEAHSQVRIWDEVGPDRFIGLGFIVLRVRGHEVHNHF